ncbi:MAG: SdrD B-like domain-containing protein [Eubacteriales bacterium]|nr:SdrD B-like domain-containing protein [Eubacteriales bacterium]MDD3880895.1 SdrD B-like domain-containing protein [Eubacteriales bacterium]MDD4511738.1 SdrD B-like domain-containing protein [Eubacteriales bacterium]
MKKICFFVLALLLCAFSALALADGAITGTAFVDNDLSETMSADESPLSYLYITLYSVSESGEMTSVKTVQTAENGSFAFDTVPSGSYLLSAAITADMTPLGGAETIEGADGADYHGLPFAVGDGDVVEDIRVSMSEAPSDGQQTGTASVTVELFCDDNNNATQGKYETGDNLIGSVISLFRMQNGVKTLVAETEKLNRKNVTFEGLPAGEYIIGVSLPAGFLVTRPDEESKYSSQLMLGGKDSRYGETAPFAVGNRAIEIKAAGVPTAEIDFMFWADDDNDGYFYDDGNENGLAGVTVTITHDTTGFIEERVSDESGKVVFDNLRPGRVSIHVAYPDGYVFSANVRSINEAERSFVRGGNSGDTDLSRYLKPSDVFNYIFGGVGNARITGRLFVDSNLNGSFDEGEMPFEGASLEVYSIKGGAAESVMTTSSLQDGSYEIDDLRAGAYRLECSLPDGVYFTSFGSESNDLTAPVSEMNTADMKLASKSETTIDMGVYIAARVSGTAFLDSSYDGIRQPIEVGAQGVTVELVEEVSGAAYYKTQTGEDGSYSFDSVAPGRYYVKVTPSGDYSFSRSGNAGEENANDFVTLEGSSALSGVMELEMGARVYGVDSGLILATAISGRVYVDKDENGAMDISDSGAKGVVVALASLDGELIGLSAATDEDGYFTLENCMPGEYRLLYTVSDNMVYRSVKSETRNYMTEPFTLVMTEDREEEAIGVIQLAGIGAVIWEDVDLDGVQGKSERVLGGIGVSMKDERTGETISETTDEFGRFSFPKLMPGSYTVSLTIPDDMLFVSSLGDSLFGTVGANTVSKTFTLEQADDRGNAEVAVVVRASVSGSVYLDSNLSGVYDEGDPSVSGARLTLVSADGVTTFETESENDGSYIFAAVRPGAYTLKVERKTEKRISFAPYSEGNNDISVISETEGSTGEFALLSGESRELTVAMIQTGVIAGSAWEDLNLNGLLDEGEPTLEGVSVTLLGLEGENSVVTGADGAYRFDNLMPGEYQLAFTLTEGHLFTTASPWGTEMGSVAEAGNGLDGLSPVLTLSMGGAYLSAGVGTISPGSIGDTAFLDENENGVQDTGERGIPGITVSLFKDGAEVSSAVTDESGHYYFGMLYPGAYSLRVSFYDELKTTKQNQLSDLIDSDLPEGLTKNAEIEELFLPSGTLMLYVDMGFVLNGVKSDSFLPAEPTVDWSFGGEYENPYAQ